MIVNNPPNTIFLGGSDLTEVGTYAASEIIRPGMLVELDNAGGIIRYKKHGTAGGNSGRLVALNQSMLNKGVDDDYAVGDLMQVGAGKGGDTFWMLVDSGVTVDAGDKLASAGNGYLQAVGGGVALFSALENRVAGPSHRIRVEVV